MVLSDEQQAFVLGPHLAVLATAGPDGGPHAVPMWYAFDGSAFLMTTGRGSQKHRNIERRPDAALVIEQRRRPYYALMIRGRAEIGTETPDVVRSRVAARYLDEPELSAYLDSRRNADSVVLRFEPLEVAVYGRPPPSR